MVEKKNSAEPTFPAEHIYKSVFTNATNGIAIAELVRMPDSTPYDVRFIHVNRAFEKHTGLPFEKLPGQCISSFLPKFRFTELFNLFVNVVDHKENCSIEHNFPLLQRHWHINAYPLMKRDLFVTDVADLAPLDLREDALGNAHKLFGISLNATHDIMAICSPNGTMTRLNNAAKEYFGIGADNAIPDNIKCHQLHHHPTPCANCPLETTISHGKSASVEFISSINHRYYECNTHPVFDESNTMIYTVLRMRDISVHKEREFMLENARRQAEKANRIKGEFLANTSHELRTPLNAIIGFSDLLEEESFDSPYDAWINIINRSGKMLLSLVNNLLTFSRIEKQNLDMLPQKTEFHPLVQKSVSLATQVIDEKDVALHFKWDSNLPVWIFADAFHINQLLFALLENAVKFTNHGQVILQVEVISQTHFETLTKFTISDTGCGISDEQLHHIFSAFRQGDGSKQRKYGGLGIGLSVAKALVECMNGTIRCADTSPKGTTFELTLPLRHPKKINK